jgi:hypothetical protein
LGIIVVALGTLAFFVVIRVIIIYLLALKPHDLDFSKSILLLLAVWRATYLLDHDLVYHVWMGYDIDKSLTLKQSAWGLPNYFEASVASKTHPVEEKQNTRGITESVPSQDQHANPTLSSTAELTREAQMAHFSKNRKQLPTEIVRAKAELESISRYVAGLETLLFVGSDAGGSSRNSSNNCSEEVVESVADKRRRLMMASSSLGHEPVAL